ncbi:MAG: hypothetical protein Q8R20_00425 [Nanoarchaeota archaeon]|nr:hypothetical protein [Nanoarchaeota archaeon]
MKIKNIIAQAGVAVAALPLVGLATSHIPPRGDAGPPSGLPDPGTITTTTVRSIGDVQEIVKDIVGWVQVFFYIIATLFIILAAYGYLTSGGEAEKTKEAKNKVIYAVVAIAVALIAGGVVQLVDTFVN